MRHVRLLVPVALLCAAALPAQARAVVTSSQITSPSSPYYTTYEAKDGAGAVNDRTVTGTVDDTTGPTVDLSCFREGATAGSVASTTVRPNVPTVAGAFSTTINLNAVNERTCVLRAIPSGPPPASAAAVAPFAGPAIAVSGWRDPSMTGNVTTDGKLVTYYLASYGLEGAGEAESAADASDFDQYFFTAGFAKSMPEFYTNAWLAPVSHQPGSTRGAIVIDGRNAYTPASASRSYTTASAAAGFKELRIVSRSQNTMTGDTTLETEEPLVACPTAIDAGTATAVNCPSWDSLGVTLARTISWSSGGRVQTVKDRWKSTDGAAHSLSLLSAEQTNTSAPSAGYLFPGSPAFSSHVAGDTVAPPATSVSTILHRADIVFDEPTLNAPHGALTLSTKPDGIQFWDANSYELRYQRTIPASGLLPIDQVYSMAATSAGLQALATSAQARLTSLLGASVTSPLSVTADSPDTTVTGTARAEGGVASLTLNGTPATVAADGSWSAPLTLALGANAVSLVVTDHAGDSATENTSISYAKPPPAVAPVSPAPVKPVVKAITSKLSASKPTFSKGVLRVKLRCTADAGTTCKGTVKLTIKVKVASKKAGTAGTRTITLGRATVAVKAGATKTVAVRLSKASLKILRRAKRAAGRVDIAQTVSGKTQHRVFSLTLRG